MIGFYDLPSCKQKNCNVIISHLPHSPLMQPVEFMLRCQFLCHVLNALFFIKIALKLIYFFKKMQSFRALHTPVLPAAGSFDPYPIGIWGLRLQIPKTASPHCKLATRLDWGLCFQTPIHNISYLNCINLLNTPPNCNIFLNRII